MPALSPQQPAEITSSARSLDEMDMSWMPCSSPNLLQTCCRAFVSPSAAAEEANEVTKLYKNPCFKVSERREEHFLCPCNPCVAAAPA